MGIPLLVIYMGSRSHNYYSPNAQPNSSPSMSGHFQGSNGSSHPLHGDLPFPRHPGPSHPSQTHCPPQVSYGQTHQVPHGQMPQVPHDYPGPLQSRPPHHDPRPSQSRSPSPDDGTGRAEVLPPARVTQPGLVSRCSGLVSSIIPFVNEFFL